MPFDFMNTLCNSVAIQNYTHSFLLIKPRITKIKKG